MPWQLEEICLCRISMLTSDELVWTHTITSLSSIFSRLAAQITNTRTHTQHTHLSKLLHYYYVKPSPLLIRSWTNQRNALCKIYMQWECHAHTPIQHRLGSSIIAFTSLVNWRFFALSLCSYWTRISVRIYCLVVSKATCPCSKSTK